MRRQRIRIAVMDDHRGFVDAMAGRLADEPDIEVVGTARRAAETLDLFSRHEIDVAVLDLHLGGGDGLVVGRRLLAQRPDLAVVIVATRTDDARLLEAVHLGVRGWVSRQSDVESLLLAIRGAARGETHLPAALLTRVLVSLSGVGRAPTPEAEALATLTARELEVLHCLTEGLSRSQIGAKLHVSPNTVRTHIQSILHKLNVHSALTAVALARRAGLLEHPDQATPLHGAHRPVRSRRVSAMSA